MNLKKILLVALMIISVLAIAGCGEEEKYNTAKKELVQITDTFKTIKATDENKAKFEEAYKKLNLSLRRWKSSLNQIQNLPTTICRLRQIWNRRKNYGILFWLMNVNYKNLELINLPQPKHLDLLKI